MKKSRKSKAMRSRKASTDKPETREEKGEGVSVMVVAGDGVVAVVHDQVCNASFISYNKEYAIIVYHVT